MDALSETELAEVMGECPPHMDKLHATGHVLMEAGLQTETKHLRRTKGKISVTDGPFMETKEIVGGVFLIEADDMDEAIRLASLHPTVQVSAGERFGWRLELRPIHYFAGR
jgi:hypothetical protein